MKNLVHLIGFTAVLFIASTAHTQQCETDMRCANGTINVAGDLAGRNIQTAYACQARVRQIKSLCGTTSSFSVVFKKDGHSTMIDLAEDIPQTWVAPAVPAAPSAVSAVAGNSSALIKWGAISGAVSDYEIRAYLGNSTTPSVTRTGIYHSGSGYVFTGLTNGSQYTFQVRARNLSVFGPLSARTAAITPIATAALLVPSVPWNATASVGSDFALIRWEPSIGTVTDYEVRAYTSASSTTPVITRRNVVFSSVGFKFTGLSVGTAYTFRIRARNSTVYSPLSLASNAITPRGFYNCKFGGKTIAHGSYVTAYKVTSATAPLTCSGSSERRYCNDGILSGSYQYNMCIDECVSCGA